MSHFEPFFSSGGGDVAVIFGVSGSAQARAGGVFPAGAGGPIWTRGLLPTWVTRDAFVVWGSSVDALGDQQTVTDAGALLASVTLASHLT